MELRVQILAILISLTILSIILVLVYKRRLREEYSLLWLLAGITLLGLSLFRGVLTRMASFLQITYAPSLLFAVGTLFGLVIVLSHAVAITNMARQDRDQAQKIAILEWRLDQLRAEMKADRDDEPSVEGDLNEEALIGLEEPRVSQ